MGAAGTVPRAHILPAVHKNVEMFELTSKCLDYACLYTNTDVTGFHIYQGAH